MLRSWKWRRATLNGPVGTCFTAIKNTLLRVSLSSHLHNNLIFSAITPITANIKQKNLDWNCSKGSCDPLSRWNKKKEKEERPHSIFSGNETRVCLIIAGFTLFHQLFSRAWLCLSYTIISQKHFHHETNRPNRSCCYSSCC